MRSLDLTELNRFFNTPRPKPQTAPRASTTPQDKCLQEYSAQTQSRSETTFEALGDIPRPMPDICAERRRCPILVEHTKCFLDDFQNRTNQNRTWFDVKLHLAVVDGPTKRRPSHSSSATAISSQILNPHAAPFISSRPLALPHQPVLPQAQVPAWFPAFCAGTQITVTPRHFNEHVAAVVDYRSWTSVTIAELAQHFCWRGAEGMSREVAGVATFAQAVHARFGSVYGVWYANEFMWRLRESVLGAFKAVWKSTCPPQASTVAYVSSALSLTAFIGDLFTHELFPVSQVHLCLSLLVAESTTIEHVHAIHLLLLHANRGAWSVNDVWVFVSTFARRLGHLDGRGMLRAGVNVSLVGREIKEDEVGAWIGEITEMVRRWEVAKRSSGSCHAGRAMPTSSRRSSKWEMHFNGPCCII